MFETIQKFEKLLKTIGDDVKKIKEVVLELQTRLHADIFRVQEKVEKLGAGCKRAFEQTKIVINKLSEHQQIIGESLDSYGGVIEAATWNF